MDASAKRLNSTKKKYRFPEMNMLEDSVNTAQKR